MLPAVTALVERAQRDGKLRADFGPTDVPFIEFMLAMAAGYAGPVRPGIWRRYLALITDGMRPCRDGISPLPCDALTPEEMAATMRSALQQPPGPPDPPTPRTRAEQEAYSPERGDPTTPPLGR